MPSAGSRVPGGKATAHAVYLKRKSHGTRRVPATVWVHREIATTSLTGQTLTVGIISPEISELLLD